MYYTMVVEKLDILSSIANYLVKGLILIAVQYVYRDNWHEMNCVPTIATWPINHSPE